MNSDQDYWPEALSGLRYDRAAIIGDLVRGGFGVLATFGPLLVVPDVHPAFIIILGSLGLLFGWFLFRTALRWPIVVSVGPTGLEEGRGYGPARAIDWSSLSTAQLRYYSTKRDRDEGWLQLELTDDTGAKVTLDSNLQEFATVGEYVAIAAQRGGVLIDATSADNFLFLGVAPRWLTEPLAPSRTDVNLPN
ncbi:MAG: hypothetical protein AAF556_07380 [Pseudomonadota bacterium]